MWFRHLPAWKAGPGSGLKTDHHHRHISYSIPRLTAIQATLLPPPPGPSSWSWFQLIRSRANYCARALSSAGAKWLGHSVIGLLALLYTLSLVNPALWGLELSAVFRCLLSVFNRDVSGSQNPVHMLFLGEMSSACPMTFFWVHLRDGKMPRTGS